MPWLALGKRYKHVSPGHNNAPETILLDYDDIPLPIAIVTAIKNKHFLVLSTILISVILRVQIILTSGLFSTNLTVFHHDVPADLLDRFSDHIPEIPNDFIYDPRLYGSERASWSIGLNPNFTMPGLALQTFDAEKALATIENATELSIAVEGVTASLDCEEPETMMTSSLLDSRLNYEVVSILLNRTIRGGIYMGTKVHEDTFFLIYYWEDHTAENNLSIPFFLAVVVTPAQRYANNTRSFYAQSLVCKMTWPISQFMATYEAGTLNPTF
ncbi:hypothetical protein F5Y00DRAFT_269191 [Daldinia vernicosa]|uniref:uncharacterized protein n=1 Tax=Daldinia vernicosa TaxID=114800 RepID=UPI002007E865|nr:uncharacterized protein F5Y00DRAFT_269191 [Daldinia vernicosa]KAI0853804.1 hypothetical protein F5Y00DRAFT_269191 [Daldinia vernicosa]